MLCFCYNDLYYSFDILFIASPLNLCRVIAKVRKVKTFFTIKSTSHIFVITSLYPHIPSLRACKACVAIHLHVFSGSPRSLRSLVMTRVSGVFTRDNESGNMLLCDDANWFFMFQLFLLLLYILIICGK